VLKFVYTRPDGAAVLFLGLSQANLDLLPDDKPIRVVLAEVGQELSQLAEVVIFAGATEAEMMDQVARAGLIGPDTDVRVDPRTL
jgi:hypothetical protein